MSELQAIRIDKRLSQIEIDALCQKYNDDGSLKTPSHTIKAIDFQNPYNIGIDIYHEGNAKELGLICKIWNTIPGKHLKNVKGLVIKKSNKNVLADCNGDNIITLYTQFLCKYSLAETIKRITTVIYHEIGHVEFNNLTLKQKVCWYKHIKDMEISSYIYLFKNKLRRTQKNYKNYIGLEFHNRKIILEFYNREIIRIKKVISTETYAELYTIQYSCGCLHKINVNYFNKILSIYKKLHEFKQQ